MKLRTGLFQEAAVQNRNTIPPETNDMVLPGVGSRYVDSWLSGAEVSHFSPQGKGNQPAE